MRVLWGGEEEDIRILKVRGGGGGGERYTELGRGCLAPPPSGLRGLRGEQPYMRGGGGSEEDSSFVHIGFGPVHFARNPKLSRMR